MQLSYVKLLYFGSPIQFILVYVYLFHSEVNIDEVLTMNTAFFFVENT